MCVPDFRGPHECRNRAAHPVRRCPDAVRIRAVSPKSSPSAAGAVLALLAALSFGLTTPIIERAGHGLGPFSTAALLYAGAALSAIVLGRLSPSSGAPLRRAHLLRLLGIALAGGAVAPSLLAWGLQRSGATTGSLLLNLEAVFTVLLARFIYREQIGKRVAVALTLMALGGAALTLDAAFVAGFSALGSLAIVSATAAWGLDNTLSRGLADNDPVQVVASKGALGAAVTGIALLVAGESRPTAFAVWVLLACGATGYGLSLRLYLLAQRRIGAARTGSIFAVAPFAGAAAAWALGDHIPGAWTFASAALFAVGVVLHVTERHGHVHIHEQVEHDHPHRHDDGHHDHRHEPVFVGEHSHPHRHRRLEHEHEHAADVHHEHEHS
jgi:drug/metabolite transporter (DMT)-like permease